MKLEKIIYIPSATYSEESSLYEETEESHSEIANLEDIPVFQVHLESLDDVIGWRRRRGKGFLKIVQLHHMSGEFTILLRQQPKNDSFLLQVHFKSNSGKEREEEVVARILQSHSGRKWSLSDLADVILGGCSSVSQPARPIFAGPALTRWTWPGWREAPARDLAEQVD